MSHIPLGYEICDGKAVIAERNAEIVRQIFLNYISGMSLSESARAAGHPMTHSMVKRLLQRKCYIGDKFYPQIIEEGIYQKANVELAERAKKLNVNGRKRRKNPVIHTKFVFSEILESQEDFKKQAEYLYSLIGVK